MPDDKYDVTVIGAGPGGYVAAIRCSQLGLKTAIVEKQYWGGVCVVIGCIPSKALLKSAEIAHLLRNRGKEFGFSFDNLRLDYPAAVKRSRQVSQKQQRGVQFLMKKNKIQVCEGEGILKDANTVDINLNSGEKLTIQTNNIVIASGARPKLIPGVEADGKKILTYKEAILQEILPKSAIIIGAGAIGVEMGYVWHSYGVDITIVEMLSTLVPLEDEEIGKELEKQFKRNGIKNIFTDTKVEKVKSSGKMVSVTVSRGGETQTLDAEQVLIVTGVQPNTENIGLENAGVKFNDRGFINIDESMRTNIPNIYAIGDVTGKVMLAHVGSAQGHAVAEVIAGNSNKEINYNMMPWATYCQPQIASFGYTEKQAKEKGYEINIGRYNFLPNGKAQGIGDYAGFVKIISDKKYGEILGAHMIGPEVTELLPELTLAQYAELTADDIAHTVHAHPTLSEVLMEAAHNVTGQSVHG